VHEQYSEDFWLFRYESVVESEWNNEGDYYMYQINYSELSMSENGIHCSLVPKTILLTSKIVCLTHNSPKNLD